MRNSQTDLCNALLISAIARLEFLSCREKQILAEKLDNISDLALLSIEDISRIAGRRIKSSVWHSDRVIQQAECDAALMRAYSVALVPIDSECYPPLLREIHDPPYALFCRGNHEILHRPCCAVVGTRKPTRTGMKAAFDFSSEAVHNEYTVVSGLALGIDACAHRGALDAVCNGASGNTAAVLACGVDCIYPAANKKLAAAILQNGGCIISEYAPGETPKKWRFPARNRIISGLSALTLIAEAPPKSGALITADFALEQNRELLFHAVAAGYEQRRLNGLPPQPGSAGWYLLEGAPVAASFAEALNAASGPVQPYTVNDQPELGL